MEISDEWEDSKAYLNPKHLTQHLTEPLNLNLNEFRIPVLQKQGAQPKYPLPVRVSSLCVNELS